MYVVMIGGIDVGEDGMWALPDELLPDNCVVVTLHLFFLSFVVGYYYLAGVEIWLRIVLVFATGVVVDVVMGLVWHC